LRRGSDLPLNHLRQPLGTCRKALDGFMACSAHWCGGKRCTVSSMGTPYVAGAGRVVSSYAVSPVRWGLRTKGLSIASGDPESLITSFISSDDRAY
jgi:hypothetical protein